MSYGAPYCPVHEYERRRCSLKCFEQRRALRDNAQALRNLWHNRLKLGWKPMPKAIYARLYGGSA